MYIFKLTAPALGGGRENRYYTAPDFHPYEVEQNRPTGKTIGGLFTEVVGTGRYRKDVISIRSDGEEKERKRASGVTGEFRSTVHRTAAGIKSALRKVRPEEQEVLARYDARIADLEEQLKQVRKARREAVADAWNRAHVVRLQEVEAKVIKKS